MNKYKTVAYEVENDVQKIIAGNEITNRPWQLINCLPVSRTLECSEKEIEELILSDAMQRPGYERNGNIIYIPNLFLKISGQSNTKLNMTDCEAAIFNSLSEFACINPDKDKNISSLQSEIENLFNNEGLLDAEKVYSSEFYNYTFLRKEYQDIVIQKINTIIKNRNIIFTDRLKQCSPEYIADILLRINTELLQMFNGFDFQSSIPKIIINNNSKERLLEEQAIVLCFFNQIGFDIIIQSTEGFADIENALDENIYNIFYHSIPKDKKQKKHTSIISKVLSNKLYISLASALISTLLLFGGINIVRGNMKSSVVIVVPDQVKILKVTPTGPVKAGVESEFKVEVQFNLKDVDKAFLDIGAADGKGTNYFRDGITDPNTKYYIKSSAEISKGTNKYTFTIKATPKLSEPNLKFSSSISLHNPDGKGGLLAKDFYSIEVDK